MSLYLNPIIIDDLTLSIDNVVLDFWVSDINYRDLIEARINCLIGDGSNIIIWEGNKPGTFHKQYLFKISSEKSFWLGHGLIATGIASDRYRLEFNPNKVADHEIFKTVHGLLLKSCRQPLTRIARFDLAIDIPVDRSKCFLVKDRRLYIERRHGTEFTQYLGSKSSSVGRVKLYNKSAEAKLDCPLTRLELTLDPRTPYEEVNFPTVFAINSNLTDQGNELRITETDRFILNALLHGVGVLGDLGRKTRAKMEVLLDNCVQQVKISKKHYIQILQQLERYIANE